MRVGRRGNPLCCTALRLSLADALAAGADDVLYKPVDVAILVDTVNKCAKGPGGSGGSRPICRQVQDLGNSVPTAMVEIPPPRPSAASQHQ